MMNSEAYFRTQFLILQSKVDGLKSLYKLLSNQQADNEMLELVAREIKRESKEVQYYLDVVQEMDKRKEELKNAI